MNLSTALRVLVATVGLAAILLSIEALMANAAKPVAILWYWPGSSLAALSAWRADAVPEPLLRLVIAQLATHVAAIITACLLAARINRHKWDWAMFGLLFPPSVAVLPWLRRGTADTDRWGGVVGRIGYFYMALTTRKKCGRCGRPVPLYMRAREACPHCRTVWAQETHVSERYLGEADRR